MANKRLGAFGLIMRMGVVLFLLTAVYLAFLIMLMRMGVDFVGLLVFAALMLGAQYFFSHRLVLLASGAREVSREQAPYRELAADRGSALITGAPSALASELQKISGTIARIPQRDLRQVEAASAFFIIPVTS